ncbi:lysyl oxidase family protein [Microlunatus spumicola]|uniref:Lysyl oxidase family protein n=1 Tax=Microlunatus spumicola TaxID=81499 RepID=A0ABP6XRT5_9ACTN
MNRRPRVVRHAVRSLVVAAAVAATAVAGAVPAGAATRPALTLEASRSSVTVYRYSDGDEAFLDGDLGVYAVADAKQAFEVRAERRDYDHPVVARLVRKGRDRTLPAPPDLSGLANFSRTTFRDSRGKVVTTSTSAFCPDVYEPVRRSPSAPASSPYPQGCGANPYALGAVWGLQRGYAASLGGEDAYYGISELPDLKPGSYVATTSITPAYRTALRIPVAKAQATVHVTVVEADDDGCEELRGCRQAAKVRTSAARVAAARTEKAPTRLTGSRAKPSGPLPDLRSLPAWGIVSDGRYLNFSATVWNAGPGRLVVDGFRDSKDENLMNAYQYFFTASGKQKGYAPVGGMEWDARDHHQHWHFQDFARYSLVSADHKTRVVSGKEAFCLANTDAVDYTVKGASWQPRNTDLSTACGSRSALGVREVLDTGSGDTYEQFREGQAFDLNGVANGTYYVEIAANPDRVLYERSTKNNVSQRKVVIGGTKGKRTVQVAKVGVIVEPPVDVDEGDDGFRR